MTHPKQETGKGSTNICSGCGTPRHEAIAAIRRGAMACCPDCSTLTVEERNAIRLPADATDWRALCAQLVDEAPYESPTTCLARDALASQRS